MPLTPQDFVSKWKRVTAREKQTYQEHTIELSHNRLDEAVFAAYGWKNTFRALRRREPLKLSKKSLFKNNF